MTTFYCVGCCLLTWPRLIPTVAKFIFIVLVEILLDPPFELNEILCDY